MSTGPLEAKLDELLDLGQDAPITAAEARQLARLLISAADAVDRWTIT